MLLLIETLLRDRLGTCSWRGSIESPPQVHHRLMRISGPGRNPTSFYSIISMQKGYKFQATDSRMNQWNIITAFVFCILVPTEEGQRLGRCCCCSRGALCVLLWAGKCPENAHLETCSDDDCYDPPWAKLPPKVLWLACLLLAPSWDCAPKGQRLGISMFSCPLSCCFLCTLISLH